MGKQRKKRKLEHWLEGHRKEGRNTELRRTEEKFKIRKERREHSEFWRRALNKQEAVSAAAGAHAREEEEASTTGEKDIFYYGICIVYFTNMCMNDRQKVDSANNISVRTFLRRRV